MAGKSSAAVTPLPAIAFQGSTAKCRHRPPAAAERVAVPLPPNRSRGRCSTPPSPVASRPDRRPANSPQKSRGDRSPTTPDGQERGITAIQTPFSGWHRRRPTTVDNSGFRTASTARGRPLQRTRRSVRQPDNRVAAFDACCRASPIASLDASLVRLERSFVGESLRDFPDHRVARAIYGEKEASRLGASQCNVCREVVDDAVGFVLGRAQQLASEMDFAHAFRLRLTFQLSWPSLSD